MKRSTKNFHIAIPVILSVMFAVACGSKEVTSTKNQPVAEKPTWVDSRPVNASYYIGIGACSKITQPLDYAGIAKKNALNDLASGISVKVQGQTFLNSLEVNKNFSEEFISTISTTTDEQVENYEIAGQWENEKEFWVYYRLSKAEYQRQKQEKQNQALRASYDYYIKGKEAEANYNLPQAIDLYFHGLFELKEYWNAVNEMETDSGKIFLDNEIYSSLQRVSTGISLIPETNKLVLSNENNYSQSLTVDVQYKGVPVKNIPVQYQYDVGRYMKPKLTTSDVQGKIYVLVNNVNTEIKDNVVNIELRLEELAPQDLDKSITTTLIENMRTDKQAVPITLVTPSFFITSAEKNYDVVSQSPVLSQSFRETLVKKGMQLSDNSGEASYVVNITSNTLQGAESQGFTVALLEMNVEVRNRKTGEVVFQKSANNIKGLQLNQAAAGVEAYKKGREMIEKEIVKTMLEAIL